MSEIHTNLCATIWPPICLLIRIIHVSLLKLHQYLCPKKNDTRNSIDLFKSFIIHVKLNIPKCLGYIVNIELQKNFPKMYINNCACYSSYMLGVNFVVISCVTGDKVKHLWENLRKAFVRDHKKVIAGHASSYYLYNDMIFLESYVAHKRKLNTNNDSNVAAGSEQQPLPSSNDSSNGNLTFEDVLSLYKKYKSSGNSNEKSNQLVSSVNQSAVDQGLK
ncbi:uncharacterized protein LOC103317558 [Nasonia vitripennis]|uniref:Uncharacterized protein n=1 Tax=Nasonia vitripennis TaxID=7425 RepID=A0A7M7QGA7_NASVI|nr:uncharacterized protein LOC103317558 [Nasonia vitripennis]